MKLTDVEQRVVDGTTWETFCDQLKLAGKIIQSDRAPKDPFNQSEGYRYLARLLRGGLESYMENSDSDFPQLCCSAHETIKLGADNPDNRYLTAPINPLNDYRIIGTRGTVDYLGIGSIINRYAIDGTMETTGYIDSRDVELNADGSLEITISQKPQQGNWLPINEYTNAINIRQTFQDRKNEKPADLKIERIYHAGSNDPERPVEFSAGQLEKGLLGAVNFVQGAAQLFENWSESFSPTNNQLPAADQGFCQAIGGDPNIYYFHSSWSIAEDEVLIIDAPIIPECQTWNFQLNNWWMESLDYRYHCIHVNKHTAHYAKDGSVRLIISHKNPGVSNWIETAGHSMGTMCWRWIGAKQHPPVHTKIQKFKDII